MAQEYEFDRFRISALSRKLQRDGVETALTGREFDVLWVLVEHPGVPMGWHEIADLVWRDANVTKDNLRQQIRSLRRKLGKDSNGNDYILTIKNRGYQLGAIVIACPNGTYSGPISQAPPRPDDKSEKRRTRMLTLVVMCIAIAAIVGSWTVWQFLPKEVLQSVRQLTRDGRDKRGPMVLGDRVYFNEPTAEAGGVASVPIGGGEVTYLKLPLPGPELLSSSAARRSLVIFDGNHLYDLQIDSLALQRLPQPPGHIWTAAWDPAGRRLAVADEDSLMIFEPEKAIRPIVVSLPGPSRLAGWDPQGSRLRFDQLNTRNDTRHFWEFVMGERTAHELAPLSSNPLEMGGAWTSDGRFFAFAAGTNADTQIWVAEGATREPRSYQVTKDPRKWDFPTTVPGSNAILALGRQAQGRLAVLPITGGADTGRILLPGISGYELDYSRDGQWIAYTQFPEHTIWRCRVDGREVQQLTPPGLFAHQAHWSPDGTRIAFMGRKRGDQSPSRIYLVPSSGGALDTPLPQGDPQGVPTWSPDGRSVFFGDLISPRGFERASIHALDLRTQTVSTVAAPMGMWSPRMSPDGKYLAAISYDNRSLYIRDNLRRTWQKCATFAFVEEIAWPHDSLWVQFVALAKPGEAAMLYRTTPSCGEARPVVDLSRFQRSGDDWIGITPDGYPIAMLATAPEIYAIDWQLRRRIP